jgi:polyisoprenoid-binding protein YceI
VEGRFDRWSGTIITDPSDFTRGSVEVAIEAASINTNNESRDRDLRGRNFFLADSFPIITFKSNRVEVQGTAIRIMGDLTMRGVTRPVVLAGEFLGREGSGPGERIGFEASTKIDRTDWGVTWNRVAEGGGAMLGDEVTIELTVAGVRPRQRPAQ